VRLPEFAGLSSLRHYAGSQDELEVPAMDVGDLIVLSFYLATLAAWVIAIYTVDA